MEGHGHGGGKGPGGGGPDDGIDLAACECWVQRFGWGSEPVAHKNGGAHVHLVLDFSFCQRCSIVDAPVNGLETAIDEAFLEKSIKCLECPGLVVARHCLIWLVPAAKTADAPKLRRLQIDVLLRIRAACIQDCRGGHFELF